MKYMSTRDNWQESESREVIRLGMVPEGGLFVPSKFPAISLEELKTGLSYKDCAYKIMNKYLTDYDDYELKDIITRSYGSNFTSPDIAPLYKYDDITGFLELWHGPTAAFKDMALQCMPRLLIHALHPFKESVKVMILVATSGDTGKAALEGFKNMGGTRIITFYPEEGVSIIQKQQMVTTNGMNTRAVGVKGNFDDCQTAVKKSFQDKNLRAKAKQKGYIFSSANSINWGRLVPQIAYYFWAYLQMANSRIIRIGDQVNICVPTGNFGNILASYYAYKMGLPVRRFICASNKNNILTDFINTGDYNVKRTFHTTVSPSMDILISSNLERLIFDLLEQDGKRVCDYYDRLKQEQSFTMDPRPINVMQKLFYGGYAGEEDTFNMIADVFNKKGYMLDTHTAVGFYVLKNYREITKDMTPALLTATANPYKFPAAVYYALTKEKVLDDFKALKLLTQKTGIPVPRSLLDIETRDVTNRDVINIEDIRTYIEQNL
ncbi:MAG: threonine synthase [Spirochaetales bacterium]|nr:threonine synthase [Spirochaetales bacterium]